MADFIYRVWDKALGFQRSVSRLFRWLTTGEKLWLWNLWLSIITAFLDRTVRPSTETDPELLKKHKLKKIYVSLLLPISSFSFGVIFMHGGACTMANACLWFRYIFLNMSVMQMGDVSWPHISSCISLTFSSLYIKVLQVLIAPSDVVWHGLKSSITFCVNVYREDAFGKTIIYDYNICTIKEGTCPCCEVNTEVF